MQVETDFSRAKSAQHEGHMAFIKERRGKYQESGRIVYFDKICLPDSICYSKILINFNKLFPNSLLRHISVR